MKFFLQVFGRSNNPLFFVNIFLKLSGETETEFFVPVKGTGLIRKADQVSSIETIATPVKPFFLKPENLYPY